MCFWTECNIPIGSEPLYMFRIVRGLFEIIQIEMKLATYNEVIEFMQMQNPRECVKIACEIFLE